MKLMFMGTPDIAAACLSVLCDSAHTVAAVVTQADRPKGRGYTLTPPPVKTLALSRGIPVYQPDTLRGAAFDEVLRTVAPDIIIVVAYGKILPPSVLSFPRYGCVNLHASLLPKYRGAAPIQRAIMEGERETGLTTMYMAAGLDTGDMLLTERIPIGPQDTFGTVHDRMAALGGPLLLRTIEGLEAGTITPRPQDDTGATYAHKIEKEDCHIDFTRPAAALDPFIRGLSPVPLAFAVRGDGKKMKIVAADVTDEAQGAPGRVLRVSDEKNGGILVACGEGALWLREILPEGKGRMRAADYVRGRGITEGEVFS